MGLALSVAACTPTTEYRRSAFVPAVRPIPFDGRTAEAGTLRLEATYTNSSISENLAPQVGDSALIVPKSTMEGSAMVAVSPHAELGIRAMYADYSWTQVSADGTMPIPGAGASTGYGPEIRLSFPIGHDGFALGVAGNLMLYHVPYSEWQLSTTCTPSPTCLSTGGGTYGLIDTRGDDPMVYNLGLYPSYAFNGDKYGHLVGIIAATEGFSNDGFSNTAANGSTLNSVGPIWIVGLGYGLSRDWGRFSANLYKPLTDSGSPANYGFGFQISLGVNLELWKHQEPAPPPPQAVPPPPPPVPAQGQPQAL
jgi:hypothetical protein